MWTCIYLHALAASLTPGLLRKPAWPSQKVEVDARDIEGTDNLAEWRTPFLFRMPWAETQGLAPMENTGTSEGELKVSLRVPCVRTPILGSPHLPSSHLLRPWIRSRSRSSSVPQLAAPEARKKTSLKPSLATRRQNAAEGVQQLLALQTARSDAQKATCT